MLSTSLGAGRSELGAGLIWKGDVRPRHLRYTQSRDRIGDVTWIVWSYVTTHNHLLCHQKRTHTDRRMRRRFGPLSGGGTGAALLLALLLLVGTTAMAEAGYVSLLYCNDRSFGMDCLNLDYYTSHSARKQLLAATAALVVGGRGLCLSAFEQQQCRRAVGTAALCGRGQRGEYSTMYVCVCELA